jgi:thiol-disulfide isomerase/thioredoxin
MLEGDLEILVFTASGCPACRAMEPDLDRLEVPDSVSLVRVDASIQPELADELSVRATPTFVARRGGKELWRSSGRKSAADLRAMIEAPDRRTGNRIDARLRVGTGTLLLAIGVLTASWLWALAGVAVALWGVAACRRTG